MNNYNKLKKYLENSGNVTVILSFDTLKEILDIEVITSVAKDRKAPSGGKSRTREADDAAIFA